VGDVERVVVAATIIRVVAATAAATVTPSAAPRAAAAAAAVVVNYLANIYNLSVIIYIEMPATKKKGTTSTALTRRKKRPTKKQKRAVRKAVNQLKTNYTKTADVVADHLGLPGTDALKENLHSLKLGDISKKTRQGITHDVYHGTKFLKSLQWPRLDGLNWKCPPKKQAEGEIAQGGGRRRKKRKRHTRRKRKRKRRRRRRRKRRRRSAKKKSRTASMKQLKSWIGSTEFNKLKI